MSHYPLDEENLERQDDQEITQHIVQIRKRLLLAVVLAVVLVLMVIISLSLSLTSAIWTRTSQAEVHRICQSVIDSC